MMDKQNSDLTNQEQSEQISSPKNRRSFLKKAAVGSALFTTVASRPVFAASCSISGNLSNNTSAQHFQQTCAYNTISPGGWLIGIASGNAGSNPSLWPETGFSRTAPLNLLLPGTTFTGTIEDALGGGNHGWERQAACAALNAALWQNAISMCTADPSCTLLTTLPDNFYFPFTLSYIQETYANGQDSIQQSTWETMQNIE
ncbi:MAG: twin-arginine translocation signal domain-containing protein [Pseudomonadota bacterium]